MRRLQSSNMKLASCITMLRRISHTASNGDEIRRTASNHTPNSGNAKGKIECPFPTEDVTAEAPEHRAEQQTDILR